MRCWALCRSAAGVVETLRRRLQVSARVLREGSWQLVPARELVPGDIIPADVKLLTGESQEVDKAPSGMLSSGAVVRRGEGNGVVMGVVMLTGARTYFGRTMLPPRFLPDTRAPPRMKRRLRARGLPCLHPFSESCCFLPRCVRGRRTP